MRPSDVFVHFLWLCSIFVDGKSFDL
jgi:hypothetical protein